MKIGYLIIVSLLWGIQLILTGINISVYKTMIPFFTNPPVYGLHTAIILGVIVPSTFILGLIKFYLSKRWESVFLRNSIIVAFFLLLIPGILDLVFPDSIIIKWMGFFFSITVFILFFFDVLIHFKLYK